MVFACRRLPFIVPIELNTCRQDFYDLFPFFLRLIPDIVIFCTRDAVKIKSNGIHTLSTCKSIGGSKGGVPGARPPLPPPHYRTQFFRFASISMKSTHVGGPGPPPTENPGSATEILKCYICHRHLLHLHHSA